LSEVLLSQEDFKLTVVLSIEERFTHACTPKWRFACLREAASAKAGHAGMPVFATGELTNKLEEIIIIFNTLGGYIMSVEARKKDVLLRLKRIEGQVRGLQKMAGNGAPCADILTQVAAVTAAMKKVGMVAVQTYMEECFEKSLKGAGMKKTAVLRDLEKAISLYIDWA
jgi:CsoR family transcriptional regulator, copper-sensing transcriptional repressor